MSTSLSQTAALMSTGARLGTKRSLAPPSPSPSVGSTASAAAGGTTPRKDRDTPGASGSHPIVYSQPQLTGTGTNTVSQMSYAVTWLRTKEEPQTYMDVLGYLSGTNWPESAQENFVELMRLNPRIQWTPDPTLSEQTWRTGTYMHRPTIPNVRNKTQLLAYLQKKTDASGVDVKDLKDGWPNCDAALSELEAAHKILVVRAKKDGVAKRVWPDDPSLFHEIDPELKLMWAKTDVPAPDSIVQRLKAAGQKPMSEDPRDKVLAAPKVEKKKRATRKTGKLTNTHMNKLFKDYSNQ